MLHITFEIKEMRTSYVVGIKLSNNCHLFYVKGLSLPVLGLLPPVTDSAPVITAYLLALRMSVRRCTVGDTHSSLYPFKSFSIAVLLYSCELIHTVSPSLGFPRPKGTIRSSRVRMESTRILKW